MEPRRGPLNRIPDRFAPQKPPARLSRRLLAVLAVTLVACNLLAVLLFSSRTNRLHGGTTHLPTHTHPPTSYTSLHTHTRATRLITQRAGLGAGTDGGTGTQAAKRVAGAAGGSADPSTQAYAVEGDPASAKTDGDEDGEEEEEGIIVQADHVTASHIIHRAVHFEHSQEQGWGKRRQGALTQLGGQDHPFNRCSPDYMGGNPDDVFPNPNVTSKQRDFPLWWMAPFFDRTSFGKEASTLLLGAVRSNAISKSSLWVGTTQGDCHYGVDDSMPRDDFDILDQAKRRGNKCISSIVVCHSLPPFWARPKNKWDTCQPCPPVGYEPAVTVGRAMAETDRYHPEFVEYCNRMDEVWVPSQFSVDVLTQSGVKVPLIRILPIAVNTTLYDPQHTRPLRLPVGQLAFGQPKRVPVMAGTAPTAPEQKCSSPDTSLALRYHLKALTRNLHRPKPPPPLPLRLYGSKGPGPPVRKRPFTFVSTFKWEMRKGWDSLLSAYLQEFTSEDNVELYILTKPFLTGGDFQGQMQAWARDNINMTEQQRTNAPTLYVISGHLSQEEYSGLYKSADAFVIATRGEGWGMPITEAMSMGLPVVATNWSGVTAFVDETVGYMVDYKLVDVPNDQPWWFRGAKWAEADVDALRERMRQLVEEPDEAEEKGRRARERMVRQYSPEVIGELIASEYARMKTMIRTGTCAHCQGRKWVAPPVTFALISTAVKSPSCGASWSTGAARGTTREWEG